MDQITVNRRNLANMLFGLYEKEPFSMSTSMEEIECGAWGGFYEMDVTTARIAFNDHNSLTAYGNFMTELISGWAKLLNEKEMLSEETFQQRFELWKKEILEKAKQLDTMEQIRSKAKLDEQE